MGEKHDGRMVSSHPEQKGEKLPDRVERVDRKLVFTGSVLKIYQDTIRVNGHLAYWDYIHHDGAAAVVAVKDNGKLLMVRQYRNALDRYTLELPAGKVDRPDEPRIECASRELEEESGYRCDNLQYLMSINTTVAFCDEAIDIFLAEDLVKSHQHLDDDESLFVEEWELDDLLDLIYAGKLTDGKTVASILAYACLLNRRKK